MPKAFSIATLGKFEDAAASIPLRQLTRAFDAVGIRIGEDPGGVDGARKVQFRRYVAGVDQHDPRQLEQLGSALGALIAEVAESKVEFLVNAAERDGFGFANGVFRPATTSPEPFAVTSRDDLRRIDDRCKQLTLLACDRPEDAFRGGTELVESLCHTVAGLLDVPLPKASALDELAAATLEALGRPSSTIDDVQGLIASFERLQRAHGARRTRTERARRSAARDARLAIALAVAFAVYVADLADERAAATAS